MRICFGKMRMGLRTHSGIPDKAPPKGGTPNPEFANTHCQRFGVPPLGGALVFPLGLTMRPRNRWPPSRDPAETFAPFVMPPARPPTALIPRVALLFEATNAYARSLLLGIGDYVLSHGPWSLHYAELGREGSPAPWIRRWNGDGIIVRGENKAIARAAARFRGPIVDLTPSRLIPRAPWAKSDDDAIARLAADHFLERGFRHLAFCGDPQFNWSNRRGERFSLLVRAAGRSCAVYQPRDASPPTSDRQVDAIAEWLVTLPKPIGVFACYDNRGQQVLEACRRAGLSVPEAVAVLGVDNDEVLCALSPPPMSSVMLNPRRVGWDGAALLSLMMQGEKLEPVAHLIPPIGVATRQSTDILAVSDPKTSAALRYIREHACDGIRVSDVLRHCPMARRALEMRFNKLIGRTPRQEILRVQLNRVKELLVGTELPLAAIAERAGFDPAYLSGLFRAHEDLTPSEYRRRYGRAR
jgi:LacI family transcriptional regulator